jgi:hypothetical protein
MSGHPPVIGEGVGVAAGRDVETGAAVLVGDGITDVIADGEEDRAAADCSGDGDGVGAHDATTNRRNALPADRCMRFAFDVSTRRCDA